MAKVLHIELVKIDTEGLQTRAALDMETVREYAEAEAERGAVFPPVVVFLGSDGKYRLADGFHRVTMARQQGKKRVAAEVREGGFAEALTYALTANAAHGLRRTVADKRNAVMVAYKHRITLGLGEVPAANAVAQLVGVSNHFAGLQLGTVPTWASAQERTGRDGKTYGLPPPPVRRSVPPERAVNGTDGTDETDGEADRGQAVGSRQSAVGNGKTAGDGTDGEADGTEKRLTAPPQTGNAASLSPPPVRRTTPPPVRRNPASGPADGRGREVPPDLLEIWNRRGEARELATSVSRVRVALRNAQDGKDPLWAEINFGSALAHLDMAYKEIAAAEPWCVCPMCQGIGCETCRVRGLLGKFRYDNVVPESLKRVRS